LIAVNHRRLERLVPNPLSKLFDFAQNLYVGYSQVQRDTLLTKSVLRVLTLTVPNPGSLRASCCQSHSRKKLDIRSIKRLLLLSLAHCIKYIMIDDSSSIFSPVRLCLTSSKMESSPSRYPSPSRLAAEDGDTREYVVGIGRAIEETQGQAIALLQLPAGNSRVSVADTHRDVKIALLSKGDRRE
jgi:hypothetical protein